ncbi:MAG: DUF2062 domain-containing protein [Verrucomicrobiota bacterium]
MPGMKWLREYLQGLGRKLFSLKDTPHAIAGGVAIGVFVGFTPLFGVKTLLSLGLAYGLRCNPIAAIISVSLHDVLTPFVPFLMRFEYDIGYWVMSHPHHLPPKFELLREHFHLSEMLKWTTFFTLGLPLLVGSLFVSAPSAVIFYFLVLTILKARQGGREAGTG